MRVSWQTSFRTCLVSRCTYSQLRILWRESIRRGFRREKNRNGRVQANGLEAVNFGSYSYATGLVDDPELKRLLGPDSARPSSFGQ